MYDRITLLGNAQDAGRPQLGCTEKCCEDARRNTDLSRMPVSLGLQGENPTPQLPITTVATP